MADRNLLIVHTPRAEDISDWLRVKERVETLAPDIEPKITSNLDHDQAVAAWLATRSSLVFSQFELLRFKPASGKVYAGKPYNKLEQLSRLAVAGVPVPPTSLLESDFRPNGKWAPFVVVKPINGRLGRGVRLVRSEDVLRLFAEITNNGMRPMIVQPFINHADITGRPYEYRVLLAFGRPLYATRNGWTVARKPIEQIANDPGGRIASNAPEGTRTRTLVFDKAVIELARQAATVFQEVPVVAVEIIYDHDAMAYCVMEVNPRGESWHLSSLFAKKNFRPSHRSDLYRQFGALDVVAEALVDVTRREAARF